MDDEKIGIETRCLEATASLVADLEKTPRASAVVAILGVRYDVQRVLYRTCTTVVESKYIH